MHSTDVLIDAASAARRNGRHQEAECGLRDAIDASRRSGNRPQLVSALGKLAHLMRDLGRNDEALPPSEEAVRIGRLAGNPQLLAHASATWAIDIATPGDSPMRIAVTTRRWRCIARRNRRTRSISRTHFVPRRC